MINISSGISIGEDAPEFPQGLTWLNSPPLTLQSLRGKVILIDFWTYSCINCQRTLPTVRKWWDTYKQSFPLSGDKRKNSGLVIIGVHTPEFEFEKDPKNLQAALKKYGATWPVVMDNDFNIWNTYDNHFWPTEYLVDETGKIVYQHIGEGNYLETETNIRETLKKAGFKVPEMPATRPTQESLKQGQTPELYLGYSRGFIGNPAGYQKDKPYHYQAPENFEEDTIYLQGLWEVKPEYIEHPKQTKELEDLIVLSYKAKKVYLVMESASKQPLKVYITLDEAPLSENDAGIDIQFDEENQAFVEVQFSTLYNLINTPTFGDHTLKISTLEKGLRCFAFTFGS